MAGGSAQAAYDEIAAQITDGHRVVAAKMFGMPTLKVGGKAFAGLFRDSMTFKLAPADLEAARRLPGAGIFDPAGMGRPMREWVRIGLQDRTHWRSLAEKALKHVGATAPR
ncbi:MAG TPA: hypothetical protein VK131_13670 [Candidatus Acidoferrales bacterium]|nr:hypothetical protein [Candidatus Acidoferrales bacterium]